MEITQIKPVDLMTFNRDKEITAEVVSEFITQHTQEINRYQYLGDMYKGLMTIAKEDKKDSWKPDNRLTVNFAKYVTDTFTGYFNGIPVKKAMLDEKELKQLKDFDNLNDMENEESELAKMAAIYGRAYELLYQNEESKTEVTYTNPINLFMVYDDSIKQKPLFAVYYGIDNEGEVTGTLYTETEEIILIGKNGAVTFGDRKEHGYAGLPVIEYIFNEERLGIFEPVHSLVNAFNKVISEKANDVEYFSDQYIAFLGAQLDEENIKNIRDNRIINYFDTDPNGRGVDVKFLDKPDSDNQTENLLNRLMTLIFQTTMVSNISDENFGNASGVSLAYKLQAMSNLALSFQRKFQSGLNQRYKLFFKRNDTSDDGGEAWGNIKYTFTRNEPKDIKEQAETATILKGVTSEETAMSVLSVVDDPKKEIERMNKEHDSLPVLDVDKVEENLTDKED